jgi:hypothetical protein
VKVDEEEEFEVERIDGERINSQGAQEFLVKWHGYSDNERSWEPLANLKNANEMITDWHARNTDNRTRLQKHKRKRSADHPTTLDHDDDKPADGRPSTLDLHHKELSSDRRVTRSQARKV